MSNSFLNLSEIQLKDISFADLMTKRVHNILLIATKYDLFILEEDGRIDEQIYNEYTSLNLKNFPHITSVSSLEDALSNLKENHYDLIIFMPNLDDTNMFSIARAVNSKYKNIPMVVLTAFSREVSKRLSSEDLSFVDYVFSWLGNSNLLLAIIKLIEDSMNIEHDVKQADVQAVLLVENSVRFYSSVLPSLYKIIFEESREFSKEALNEHQKMLRMRGRPKILLARNYEEAKDIYTKFKENILGVVTDMSFMEKGIKEKLAGYHLAKWIKEQDRFLPIILNSSEPRNKIFAERLGLSFIAKNTKSYSHELRNRIVNEFGFGDFVIINPKTKKELYRIKNLKDLQILIHKIPDDSLHYHLSHNHFSRFLYSIAMFPIAKLIKKFNLDDMNLDEARQFIYNAIVKYRRMKNIGIVAEFIKGRYDELSEFARIGNGSLGGKGRGLAFLGNIIKKDLELNKYPNFPVMLPKTIVLSTDIFDEFMEKNKLYEVSLSDLEDEKILECFLKSELPEKLEDDLLALFDVIRSPLAIRSSSLLEDSYYQPFAGVYSTYMVPFLSDNKKRLSLVKDAIKSVYASVFFKDSKAYMEATHNVIDEEKMAVVIQEVVGSQYENRYYPSISGVVRSLNFYPLDYEKIEEGVANIALGLGKYIVDGGSTLRFSPYHPHNILQLSSVDFALRETQRQFYALDMNDVKDEFSVNDSFNLSKLNVSDVLGDFPIQFIVSTYDPQEQLIYDGFHEGGRKIISFANILQHNLFPLSEVLKQILKVTKEEMGRDIEIEFSVNILSKEKAVFYPLQIRPIVHNKEIMNEDLEKYPIESTILTSNNALGNGIIEDICDLIYVKSEGFNAANNQFVAYEIEKLNKELSKENKEYVLIGPGRWGSSDSWLGIPVKWPYITNARILVESGLKEYFVEPSQGTHFFQNLTSFGVGYFTINSYQEGEGTFDEEYLNTQPAIFETKYLRHIRFKKPIVIKINGKKKYGIVLKPEE